MEQDAITNNNANANRNHDIFISSRTKTNKCRHRVFKEESLMVPDQAYTVRELFERSVVNSMPAVNQPKAYYDEEQDVNKLLERSGVDLSTLDLVELEEYKDSIQRYIDGKKSDIASIKESQQQAE